MVSGVPASWPPTQAALATGLAVFDLDRTLVPGSSLAQALGPRDLPLATAYADAASDLPVLRACGSAVAVNPDRGLREAAGNAGWPILYLH